MSFIFIYPNLQNLEQLTTDLTLALQKQTSSKTQIVYQFFGFTEKLSIDSLRQIQAQAWQMYQPQQTIFFVLNLNRSSTVIQNALLKIVEEPPAGIDFVLVNTQNNFLATLQSRCQLLLNEEKTQDDWSQILADWKVDTWSQTPATRLAKQISKKLEESWKNSAQTALLKNTYASLEVQKLNFALLQLLGNQTAQKKYQLQISQIKALLASIPTLLTYLEANVSLKNACYFLFLSTFS